MARSLLSSSFSSKDATRASYLPIPALPLASCAGSVPWAPPHRLCGYSHSGSVCFFPSFWADCEISTAWLLLLILLISMAPCVVARSAQWCSRSLSVGQLPLPPPFFGFGYAALRAGVCPLNTPTFVVYLVVVAWLGPRHAQDLTQEFLERLPVVCFPAGSQVFRSALGEPGVVKDDFRP
jgi:hypothetical protein